MAKLVSRAESVMSRIALLLSLAAAGLKVGGCPLGDYSSNGYCVPNTSGNSL
jgi:hypothetical protein